MNRYANLFCLFFLFYTLLGLTLIPYNPNDLLVPLFEVDSIRVLYDMFVPYTAPEPWLASHYRVSIHPLYMLLLQPFALILKQLIGNVEGAALFLGSAAGACHTVLLHWLLCRLCRDKAVAMSFTLIGGICFSSIFFATVPESFVYSGVFILAYICWLFPLLKKTHPMQMSFSEKGGFLFFGVVSFGFTITNYMFFAWGLLLFIFLKDMSVWRRFLLFAKVNGVILAACIFVSLLQWMVFGAVPWFEHYGWRTLLFMGMKAQEPVSSICHSLLSLWTPYGGHLGTDLIYMDFSFSGGKIYEYVGQVFFSSLMAFPTEVTKKGLFFVSLPATWWCCLFLFLIALPLLVVLKYRKYILDRFLVFLLGILFGHFCLHFFYGYSISFLYSFHCLSAFLAVLAITYGYWFGRGENLFRKTGYIVLSIVSCFLLFNNIIRYAEVVEYCQSSYGIVCPLAGSVILYIFYAFVLCMGVQILAYSLEKWGKGNISFRRLLKYGMALYSGGVLVSLPIIVLLKTIY